MKKTSLKKILQSDKPSLARAISLIEDDSNKAVNLLSSLYPYIGKAHRIGITGPPGVGKSTLVDELTLSIRQRKKTVGIIAIDPTSIFSGGAILGDRIRMNKIGIDKGVYIRSMATRGWSGGISKTTSDAADVLDASGKSYVIVETVGVGQSEVEIFKNVDTTILVLSPESGDAIQAMKAGIMEVADIIIVNKSDRPGADTIIEAIKNTCEMRNPDCAPTVPILKTIATNSVGIDQVINELDKRWQNLKKTGQLEKKRRTIIESKLKSLLVNRIEEEIRQDKKIEKLINGSINKILKGKDSPYRAVESIIKSALK